MPEPSSKIQSIKYAPPPPELPVYGKVEAANCSFIGRTNYVAALEEKRFVFGIKRNDRRQHLYMIGKSGVGKSKLLELLIRQDIAYGYGAGIVDPDGDTVNALLAFIPENRKEDVCVIDFADSKHITSFNPFTNINPSFIHQYVQGLVEVMEQQFGESWTPRLEHLFRFACLALFDYPQATMLGIISLLTDVVYRERVVANIQDEAVKHFWNSEFSDWLEKFEVDAVAPLVHKLNQLFTNPTVRAPFSQSESKINFSHLLSEQKIILINLARRRTGEAQARFLGALLILAIKNAGMQRSLASELQSRDFYLYIDEFHDVATKTFAHFLSDAKKYGICLTIAHQYIQQLSPEIHAAIRGNIGSTIVFRVGGEDAERLEAELTPVFKAKDIINLGAQGFYAKMTIDGNTHDPFSAETLKVLSPTHRSFADEVLEASRKKYTYL